MAGVELGALAGEGDADLEQGRAVDHALVAEQVADFADAGAFRDRHRDPARAVAVEGLEEREEEPEDEERGDRREDPERVAAQGPEDPAPPRPAPGRRRCWRVGPVAPIGSSHGGPSPRPAPRPKTPPRACARRLASAAARAESRGGLDGASPLLRRRAIPGSPRNPASFFACFSSRLRAAALRVRAAAARARARPGRRGRRRGRRIQSSAHRRSSSVAAPRRPGRPAAGGRPRSSRGAALAPARRVRPPSAWSGARRRSRPGSRASLPVRRRSCGQGRPGCPPRR